MKFLLDHDVPENLAYLLKQVGHDVTLLREALPKDALDEAVLLFAELCGVEHVPLEPKESLELTSRWKRRRARIHAGPPGWTLLEPTSG